MRVESFFFRQEKNEFEMELGLNLKLMIFRGLGLASYQMNLHYNRLR